MTVSLLASLGTASPPVGAPESFLRRQLPIYEASFTWNAICGDKVACGPGAAAKPGIGAAALNTQAFLNPNGAIDGQGNIPYVYGAAGACGACWHLQPLENVHPSNGKTLGTPIVVKINDQCDDDGKCDQGRVGPVNSGFGKPVHFDLCAEGGNNGAAGQFFGATEPGELTGLAQYDPDCGLLEKGPFGSEAGTL
ncbi:MAG: hypothetical protein Q9169_001011 [Polycauliona sp. 2 TL-2023]